MPSTLGGNAQAAASDAEPEPSSLEARVNQIVDVLGLVRIVLESLCNKEQRVDQLVATVEHISGKLDALVGRRTRQAAEYSDPEGEDAGNEERTQGRELRGNGNRLGRSETSYVQGSRVEEQLPVDKMIKRMKVEVPDFHGKMEPEAFEDWVIALEDCFDWFGVPEDRKVRYVRLKLKGSARAWWGSVEEQLRRTGQLPILGWEEMKSRMRRRYLPLDYEQVILEEMLQLKQETMTVDQYTDRFHELKVRSRVVETDQQTLTRYRVGLKSELRKKMLAARLYSMEEAYQLALLVEKQLTVATRKKAFQAEGKARKASVSPLPRGEYSKPTTIGEAKGRVTGVGDCPQCYKCKGYGHFAMVCPTREKRLAFICEKDLIPIETLEEDEGPMEADGSDEGEHLTATNLPSCVIRGELTGNRQVGMKEEDWHRTNIFHTQFEHDGRGLNVIINNGSVMNVIAEDVVSCLGLKTEAHPAPYQISWVDEKSSFPVKRRCLVKFSLGEKYTDEVWCDVIPMTTCHMLLGRPWLFDRRVMYDGFHNTYSFSFHGVKLTLFPSQISGFEVKSTSAMLTMRQLAKGKAPSQDIMPEEMPQQLPPRRDILNTIDLLPGASSPILLGKQSVEVQDTTPQTASVIKGLSTFPLATAGTRKVQDTTPQTASQLEDFQKIAVIKGLSTFPLAMAGTRKF